jgi:hypothetical protein
MSDVTTTTPPNGMRWHPTDGCINSLYATIDDAATSATVEVYVSNAAFGPGLLLCTMSLSASDRADGFSLSKEDSAWWFIGVRVVAINGTLKAVNSVLGE